MANVINGDRVDYLRLNEFLLEQGYYNDPLNKKIYITAERSFTEMNLKNALSNLPEVNIKAKIDPYGMRTNFVALKNADKFNAVVCRNDYSLKNALYSFEPEYKDWIEAVSLYRNASESVKYEVNEIEANPLGITVKELDEILAKEGWLVLEKSVINGYIEGETVYLKQTKDHGELRQRLVKIFSSDKYSSFTAHIYMGEEDDDRRWILYKKNNALKIVEFEDGLCGNLTSEQKEAYNIFSKVLLPRRNVELR